MLRKINTFPISNIKKKAQIFQALHSAQAGIRNFGNYLWCFLFCVGQILIILSSLCGWVSDGVPVLKMPLVLLGDLTVGTLFSDKYGK